ncbi:hypothetical protein EDD36DRAFT_190352 [Exophiala viscosa]|uniref:Zn(2)-C6 fungal-type domain-containing protein n=1 Tax=Exophiala viscosa TaxID=2486360 RepID=A0AAN6E1S9_9EURO|nr:hypothetical protein EDD36DRAFT_190352 [Exophiala viscosa]
MGANNKILSCRPCRERKVRCDRVFPCKSCVRHRCEAQCQPSQVSRANVNHYKVPLPRALSPTPLHVLTPSTLDDVSGVLRTNNVSSAPDVFPVPTPSNEYVGTTYAQTGTGDVSDTTSLASKTIEALHAHNSLASLMAGQQPPLAPTLSSFGATLSASEKTAWRVYLADCLPPRSQCDLFVSYYFESINWIYQAIHCPSFRSKYETLWVMPVNEIDLIFLALLYAMMSPSALFIDPSTCESVGFESSKIRESAHLWFRLSRQALHAGEYESRPCLTQIEVFIVSQLYWYSTKNVEALNSAMGQTVRCAQAIGLDKDRIPSTNLSSELRHRLWWDLCSSDTFQSLCLDRQPLVQAHLSEVPMPQNCEDCDITRSSIHPRPMTEPTVMSMHTLRARLFKTMNKLYANNAAPLSSYKEVSGIDAEILAIVDQFPWYFSVSPGTCTFVSPTLPLAFDYLQWQHHLLHNSICVQRIRMYRPFLRSPQHNDCWSKCISAVEGAFGVYHAIRAANAFRFQRSHKMFAQSYQIFCSAVSIAVFLLVERPVIPTRMQSDIEVVIQDLQKLAQSHRSLPMAVDGRAVLTKLLDAYRQGFGQDDEDGVRPSNSIWQSLIPEIYAVMGGKSNTKSYLDRCAVSHIVNPDSAARTTTSVFPVGEPPVVLIATPQLDTSMTYEMSADDAFASDPAAALGFNLHFDVLNWGVEDFGFE